MFLKKLKLGAYFLIAIILTLGFSISLQSISAALLETKTTGLQIGSASVLLVNPYDNLIWGLIDSDTSTGHFIKFQDSLFADKFKVDYIGNVTAAGNITATSFIYSSDKNLKKDIKPIPSALDKILKLDGVMFNWKENNRPDMGFIAQEVEKVFPDLVQTDKTTNLKAVEYGNLTAPIIEAIKEQQKQIEELKSQIKKLNNK